MIIKNKITNHLMSHGNKKTCEKIFLKSLKELQKNSSKQSKELVKLAIIFSTPTFKLHEMTNNKLKKRNRKTKKIPSFISNKKSRTSLAIKFILSTIKKKSNPFYTKLNQEILLNAQNKGEAINIKNDIQKQVMFNKHFFLFYRWH